MPRGRHNAEAYRAQKRKEDEKRARGVAWKAGAILSIFAGLNFAQHATRNVEPQQHERAFGGQEDLRAHRGSERTESAASSYRTLYGALQKDQVLFIDEYGAAVGGPRRAELEATENGRFRIAQTWLDRQREEMCEGGELFCDTTRSIPRQLNVIAHLQGEPDGVTYLDLVRRNGTQRVLPVPGEGANQKGDGLNRIQYVHRYVGDTIVVGEDQAIVREELALFAPAMIGVESTYDNLASSGVGAGRAVQGMPNTIASHGYTPDQMTYFRYQVAFMGDLFSEHYTTLRNSAVARQIEEQYFPDTPEGHEAFVRYVLVPMTVGSYNAGPRRVLGVAEAFLALYPNKEAFVAVHGSYEVMGYDLFHIMTQEAFFAQSVDQYGPDASAYWIEALALSQLMREANLY
ncbi:hypothetical protein K2Y00_00645 [Patescibacteria group bacterium]|nr:hypothetical protein [Patescibacteria group bacterium]